MLLGFGPVRRAREQQSLALYAQRLGQPTKRPMRLGILYPAIGGCRGGASITRRYQDLGMYDEEGGEPIGCLAQAVEAGPHQPFPGRNIALSCCQRTFKTQARGIITRQAVLIGLLLEASNGPRGRLKIAKPQ